MRCGILVVGAFLVSGCATAKTDIRRLSPLAEPSQPPRQCRIVSVLQDSPAQKAGIQVEDVVQSVNGVVPTGASHVSDLIHQSPADAELAVAGPAGTVRLVKVRLNSSRPRLGAVCDLTGWRKSGVTAAGNESLTVFNGPYALTASGILDKGLVFLRVRVTNNSEKPLQVGPELFSAEDGRRTPAPVLSPKQVMCMLYGEKGAHLLALKKRRRETLDPDTFSSLERSPEGSCAGVMGRLTHADPQYAEANAEYVAVESLWPSAYKPGGVADGLIYLAEPVALPVTLSAAIEGHAMSVQLGAPKASQNEMRSSDLVRFFESQKKGAPLRLTLRKGRVFVGKFSSYDSIDEKVWFDTPSGGMLRSTSFPVTSIRTAEPLEQMPAKPTVSDQVN